MLDSLTARGQTYIARQHAIVAACGRLWSADAVELSSDISPIDALYTRAGRLFRIAEVKAREMTLRELRQHGSYLVTFDKLVEGRALAARLGVEYVLVAGLTDAIVWWSVTDSAGEWRARLRTARTTTQATCNGGKVERANAYLVLDEMQVWPDGDDTSTTP
jgi:hypothetical protein